jgi:hypothetical protein
VLSVNSDQLLTAATAAYTVCALQDLDEVLSQDIPRLMEQLPTSDVRTKAEREMAALLHTPSPLQFDDMAPPPQQGPAGASPLSTGKHVFIVEVVVCL